MHVYLYVFLPMHFIGICFFLGYTYINMTVNVYVFCTCTCLNLCTAYVHTCISICKYLCVSILTYHPPQSINQPLWEHIKDGPSSTPKMLIVNFKCNLLNSDMGFTSQPRNIESLGPLYLNIYIYMYIIHMI